MGKIYKNGILFAGSTENARSVAFDNADTGLKANNVQEAIEEVDNNINAINTKLVEKQNKIAGAATTITEKNLDANKIMSTNASGKVGVTTVKASDLQKYLQGELVNMTPVEGTPFGLQAGYYYLFSIGSLYKEGVQLAMCYFGQNAGKIYIRTWANNEVTAGWKEL